MKRIILSILMMLLLNISFINAGPFDDLDKEFAKESEQVEIEEDFDEFKKEVDGELKQFKEETKEEAKNLDKAIAEDEKDKTDNLHENNSDVKKEKIKNEEASWQEHKAKNAYEELDDEADNIESKVEDKKAEPIVMHQVVEIKEIDNEAVEEPQETQEEVIEKQNEATKVEAKEETKEEMKPEVKAEHVPEFPLDEDSNDKSGGNKLIIFAVLACIVLLGIYMITKKSKK